MDPEGLILTLSLKILVVKISRKTLCTRRSLLPQFFFFNTVVLIIDVLKITFLILKESICIYLWLCWVSIAVCWLSLVAQAGAALPLWHTSLRWLLVAECGLQELQFQ